MTEARRPPKNDSLTYIMMTGEDAIFNEHRFQYHKDNVAVFGLLLRPRVSAIAARKAETVAGITDVFTTYL